MAMPRGTSRPAEVAGGKTAPAKPASRRGRPSALRLLPLVLFLLLSLAAVLVESLGFAARVAGARGWVAAERKDAPRALALAELALRRDPGYEYAQYLRAVKLREMNKVAELKAALPGLLLSNPNQASVRRLAGEFAYSQSDFRLASDLLWQALEINPTPPSTAAGYWRMAMMASQHSGDQQRALGAAWRALALAEANKNVAGTDDERAALLQDAAFVFNQAGLKAVGGHLSALAQLGKAAGQRRR